jgi:hypothetical protein
LLSEIVFLILQKNKLYDLNVELKRIKMNSAAINFKNILIHIIQYSIIVLVLSSQFFINEPFSKDKNEKCTK